MMMLRSNLLFRHQQRLVARVAGRLGTGEAEDLASEAVLRGLARPAPDGRQAPWIETIFRNLLADRGRRWSRRQHTSAFHDGLADHGVATPEDLVLAAERDRAVAAALPGMPRELRDAVEGRFFAGRDYDEMAVRGGISVTTARTRVHRGLARLRRALAGLRALVPAWPSFQASGGVPALAALVPAAVVAVLVIAPQAPAIPSRDAVVAMVNRPLGAAGARQPAPRLADKDDAIVSNRTGQAPARGARRVRPAAPATSAADDDSAPVAVKRLDFDEDQVDGGLQQPGMILVGGDPREQKCGSLIEIPRSFEPSMTKMIEDM